MSCSRLLSNQYLQVVFVAISFGILVTNSASFIFSLSKIGQQNFYSVLAMTTNGTELIWVLLLSILVVTDLQYLDDFILNEKKWRSSAVCFFVEGIFFGFNFLDPCVVLLLCFARFRVTANPLDFRFKEVTYCVKITGQMILGGLGITTTVSFIFKYVIKTLPSKLCIPVEDPTKLIFGIKLVTWSLFFFQMVVAVSIGLGHWLLITKLQQGQNIQKSSTAKAISASLVLHLTVLTCSNLLSWLPPGVIYIHTLYLPKYPETLIAWTLVSFCSLNCLVNPVVFIITSLRAKLSLDKKCHVQNIEGGS